MDLFKKTVNDIKSLKIQGATNVAKYSIEALKHKAKSSKAKTRAAFIKDMDTAKNVLYASRITEPLMRNCLRFMTYSLEDSNIQDVKDLKNLVYITGDDILSRIIKDKKIISEIAAKKIENGMTILTHCHSSTVIDAFKSAKAEGKKFSVICTESRPLYQGRITAKEIAKLKIPVTMVVDSAVSTYIRDASMVYVGADLVTADINLANKVGTLYVALASKRVNIPFYVLAELAKFDPETIFGKPGQIEMRDPKEIWDKPPKGLQILNPAFDLTPMELISAFITQAGIVPPASFLDIVKDNAPWILRGLR
jgi:ribose 1,5-bisphosphate isomerase